LDQDNPSTLHHSQTQSSYTIAMADDTSKLGEAETPFDLMAHLVDHSTQAIKEQINKLAADSDNRIQRTVEQERIKFSESRHSLIGQFRRTLTNLRADPDAINVAVSEIDTMAAPWFSAQLNPPTLTLAPPTPAFSPAQQSVHSANPLSLSARIDRQLSQDSESVLEAGRVAEDLGLRLSNKRTVGDVEADESAEKKPPALTRGLEV
jgi:hypothetical protein